MTRYLFALGLAAWTAGCAGSNQGATGTVTGTVTYLQSTPLPDDAELRLVLENISLRDAPAGIVAERTVSTAGKPVPIPFEIDYDANIIEESHTYSMRAEIYVGGEPRFVTGQSYPVLTRGAPDHVEIIVMAFQSHAPADKPLVGTHWTLVEVGGRAIARTATGREPYLVLLEDEPQAVATGGCNQLTSAYQTSSDPSDPRLRFASLAATERACPEGVEVDRALAKALRATSRYRVDGSRLEIMDASAGVLARFQAAAIEE